MGARRVAVVLLLAAAGCAAKDEGGASRHTVQMSGLAFAPAELKAAATATEGEDLEQAFVNFLRERGH